MGPDRATDDGGAEMTTSHPFVDEHRVRIAARPEAVWEALAAVLAATPPGTGLYAGLIGAEPRAASGELLAVGATVPGFRVSAAEAARSAQLSGGHLFSRYTLDLALTDAAGGCVLSAATRARFPGPHGRLYRALVIGSGAHRLVVQRLLQAVRRRAER